MLRECFITLRTLRKDRVVGINLSQWNALFDVYFGRRWLLDGQSHLFQVDSSQLPHLSHMLLHKYLIVLARKQLLLMYRSLLLLRALRVLNCACVLELGKF